MGDGAYDADVAADICGITLDFDSTQAIEGRERERSDREIVYHAAKLAKVGSTVTCPSCKMPFEKKSYQQAFCSNKGKNNCKDHYWNGSSDERTLRAMRYIS